MADKKKSAAERVMEQRRGSGPKSKREVVLERKRGINPKRGD